MRKLSWLLGVLCVFALASCSNNSDSTIKNPDSGTSDTDKPGSGTGDTETDNPGSGTGDTETDNPGSGSGDTETDNPGSGSGETEADKPGSGSGSEETLNVTYQIYDEKVELNYSESDISKSVVQYKKSTDTLWKTLDKELIFKDGDNNAKAIVLGLSNTASYDFKVTNSLNKTSTITNVKAYAIDRSGYAHFGNTTGIGAYNNDGTLKDNAIVVYVNNANKNTVSVTVGDKTYTGLADIIKNVTKNNNYILDIRVLDEIQTQQWSKISHGTGKTAARQASMDNLFSSVDWTSTTALEAERSGGSISSNYYKIAEEEIIEYGINTLSSSATKIGCDGIQTQISNITKLNGLTNNVIKDKNPTTSSSDQGGAEHYEYDSYFNELDVKYCNNITVEGVTENAGIFQWGFCFNQCNSIEVKNLEFSGYTEDAIGIQGGSNTNKDFSGFWIHNNTFNTGVNNWDLTCENDKMDGDGSTDFKYAHNLTISYCRYNNCHKTALIGPGEGALQYNITFHHNYYNKCGSRLPFTRQSNIHAYNNYYYGSTGTNMQINDSAYLMVENSVFENTNKTFTYNKNGAIKSYNNEFLGTASSDNSTVVSARAVEITSTCKADGVTDMSKFDTDSTLFYYDSENQCSSVMIMHEVAEVIDIVKEYAGSGTSKTLKLTNESKYTGDGNKITVVETKTAENVLTLPTAPGIYSMVQKTNTDTTTEFVDSSSSNYVKYTDTTISLTDTSATETTFAYYMLEDSLKYTTGVHTISLDVTLTGIGNKWTLVEFLGADSSVAIRVGGIDTANKGKFVYTLDGKTETVIGTKTISSGSTYTITFTVDYDNNTMKVNANGEEITISGIDAITINGLKFMTATAATDRSYTVSNIEIE
ncbi:MAG: hypothetical protein ACI35W_03800 [Anaeroplasmataceae bacterium]